MKIKVEVYNQLKKLVDSGVFVVSSIDSTGKISITLNRNNLISMGIHIFILRVIFVITVEMYYA